MYEELKKYTSTIESFHMPGHKNGKIQPLSSFYDIDVTEVEGTDDLMHPQDIIKKTHDWIADQYSAYGSFMLVNGSTSGILAAISAISEETSEWLVARNCHKSVYNGCLINRVKIKTLFPEFIQETSIYGQVLPEQVEEAFIVNPQIKAVFITSPTYEGIISNIKEIAEIVHKHDAYLLVDEAHGAHLNWSNQLPESSLTLGADIVVQSTHKTLPCLTQTAMLHIGKSLIQGRSQNLMERLQKYLAVYQTSSPSYIFMCSIEQGLNYMKDKRLNFEKWINQVRELRKRELVGGHWLESTRYDMTRLTYVIDHLSIKGYELAQKLRDEYKIQVELCGEHHIVAIITMADSEKCIANFISAINSVMASLMVKNKDLNHNLNNDECKKYKNLLQKIKYIYTNPLEVAMPYYEVNAIKGRQKIKIKNAAGKISAQFLIPYPPGIPICLPGEVLSAEIVDYILELENKGKEIYGIIKGELEVISG